MTSFIVIEVTGCKRPIRGFEGFSSNVNRTLCGKPCKYGRLGINASVSDRVNRMWKPEELAGDLLTKTDLFHKVGSQIIPIMSGVPNKFYTDVHAVLNRWEFLILRIQGLLIWERGDCAGQPELPVCGLYSALRVRDMRSDAELACISDRW
ncbi:hypothetical protein X801_09667 [Opisthorchis viverrini]|uniref:Uncharacterized protein n=1 Tax=Opisthorchis viverrini TaxID=6198 RepID=A0A1S8WJC4_OPIVI|nr:hypothetical protein X801_09667 [Opisthorchis viverrini]